MGVILEFFEKKSFFYENLVFYAKNLKRGNGASALKSFFFFYYYYGV